MLPATPLDFSSGSTTLNINDLCHKRQEIPSDPPSFCSVCRDYSCPLVLMNDCIVFVAELPAPSSTIFFCLS